MLESFFVQKKVLDRLRYGPMGPYLSDLAAQLTQQNYAHRTGCILLRTADRLGRWLAQQRVAPADATTIHLQSFVASQNSSNTGRLPQVVCGVWRIAELLQPRGLLNCPSIPDAADQWLQRFDQHLLSVHGLTAKTRDNYLRYARRLISERFRDVALDWQTLSATESLCHGQEGRNETRRIDCPIGSLPCPSAGARFSSKSPRTIGIKTGHGRLNAENVTLKGCIMSAYGVGPHQVSGGPDWLGSDRFEISAKADKPTNDDAVLMTMLQDLLAERFKLVFHRETRTLRAFVLEVAKSGPKLEPTPHTAIPACASMRTTLI